MGDERKKDPDYIPDDQTGSESDESDGEHGQECTEDELDDMPREPEEMEPATRKRCRTESSKHTRNVTKYRILSPCRCRKRCISKIPEIRRAKIHSEFWSWDYNKRKTWIFHHVKQFNVKNRRENARGIYDRNFCRLYKMPAEEGNDVIVCKNFFLKTLGYKSDKVITVTLGQTNPDNLSPPPDKRGKHEPKHKISEETLFSVSNHIDSYHPAVSHYRREHAPNRLYLPSELSMKEMHEDFLTKSVDNISYETYRKTVNAKNISFAKLGEEECEMCLQFSIHKHDEQTEMQTECLMCEAHKQHKLRAEKARHEYTKDKESSGESYYSTDMQKIIMLPRLPGIKTALFTKRLVTFHQTFAPLKTARKSIGFIWHEGISGRNCEDITSSYAKFLCDELRDEKHVHIWCDNCAGQNKNWTLYTSLVFLVNRSDGPDSVTLKYLEKGHTFMSADSFHARVESLMRKEKKVFDFQDFTSIIDKCGRAVKMNFDEFREWYNGMSTAKFTHKPELKNVVEAKFEKGTVELQWKESFDETEYRKGLFLKKCTASIATKGQNLPPSRKTQRGIPKSKKNDIISKLCPLMPENRRGFWQNIPCSSVVDLITEEQLQINS